MAASAMSQRTLQGVQRLADQARIFLRRDPALSADCGALLDAIEGLQACVRLSDYLRDNTRLAFDEAFGGGTEDYNATGAMCLAAFKAALMVFESVRGDVEVADAESAPEGIRHRFEEAVRDFRGAEAEIRRLCDQFEANWPWVREELLEQSLARGGAGRRRPAKVAFDEIRSRHRREGD